MSFETIETHWFRTRTSAMLHEIGIQKTRAHAAVEVDRKLRSGEYHIGQGPAPIPGEDSREWTADGRLVIRVRPQEVAA